MKRAKNYRKRSSAHSGRFGRLRRRREAFAAKVVQAIVMAILAVSLFILEFTAIRLIRAHFLAEYGGQAWLLPIAIGLIFCFIIYRWFKLWQEIKERLREMRDDGPEGPDTPV
jgi:hypothetical protein